MTIADRAINEIVAAWQVLENNGFPPEAVGWPEKDIGDQLPGAINSAIDCLLRQRDDLLARALAAEDDAVRLHREKMDAIDRAIVAEAAILAERQRCAQIAELNHGLMFGNYENKKAAQKAGQIIAKLIRGPQ